MDSYYDAMRRALREPKDKPNTPYWYTTCTYNVPFTYSYAENIPKNKR